VMFLASTGLSNKQIARQLSICEGTVKLHLHSIYGKVAVSNRTLLPWRDQIATYSTSSGD